MTRKLTSRQLYLRTVGFIFLAYVLAYVLAMLFIYLFGYLATPEGLR